MRKILIHVSVAVLIAVVLPLLSWTPARADDMTCPTHTPVSIDIKPGSYPNKVNLASKGLFPVAVLGSEDFDASHFMPEMAHLSDAGADMTQMCAGAMAVRWKLDDVNRDGKTDLVFFFSTQETDFTVNTTSATFMAHGSYDSATLHIMGTDSVVVKP